MSECSISRSKESTLPTVTLCVLTYHRPVGVAQVLEGLGRLTFAGPPPELRIVIVDNDPDAGSRQAVTDAAESIPWAVSYHVEPQRGITYARNRALSEIGDSDWVGFIDDDEIPCPDWLDRLFRVQHEYSADVVTGPVIAEFPADTPRWIVAGEFFNQIRHTTGTRLPYCFTNNVIFRTRILRELGLEFDHRFALMGGEDRDFFQRIALAGYQIIWADDACVCETVPESRTRARWLLQRSYRLGNTLSVVDIANIDSLKTRLRLVIRACWCVIRGAFFLPLTWPLGREYPVLYLQYIYWGAGMFAGLFGLRYAEYKNIHGE